MRLLALWVVTTALVARAENPDLTKAVQLLTDLDYRRAAQTLDAAWASPGNTRDDVLRILELQGVVLALLGQDAQAQRAFTGLFSLDPARAVEGDYPPRVTTPIAAARATVKEQGALALVAVAEPGPDGSFTLRSRVERDSVRLVRRTRFRWKAEGQTAWERCELAECPARSTMTQWVATALNEFDGVLLEVSGGAPAAIVARPAVQEPPLRLNTPARIGSFAVAGAALVAVALGAGLGVAANRERLILVNAARDAEGRITGFPQSEWLARDAAQRGLAVGANTSFVAAGVAAAVAVVLFIVGGGAPAPVALGPDAFSFDFLPHASVRAP